MARVQSGEVTWNVILERAVQETATMPGQLQLGTIIKKVVKEAPGKIKSELEGRREYEVVKILAQKLKDIEDPITRGGLCHAFELWEGLKTADYETRVDVRVAAQRLPSAKGRSPKFWIKLKEKINTMILAATVGREEKRAKKELPLKFPIENVPKLLEEWESLPLLSPEKGKKKDEILRQFDSQTAAPSVLLQEEVKALRSEAEEFMNRPVPFAQLLAEITKATKIQKDTRTGIVNDLRAWNIAVNNNKPEKAKEYRDQLDMLFGNLAACTKGDELESITILKELIIKFMVAKQEGINLSLE